MNIGDKIAIKNGGKMYSMYTDMADIMNLKNFYPEDPINNRNDIRGVVGEVVAIENHPDSGKELYGIRLNNCREIIIGCDGVSVLTKNMLDLDDKLFKL